MIERALLAVLYVAIAALAGCGGGAVDDKDVATVVATKGDLVFQSSYYGEIEAKEAHPIYVPELKNLWQVTVESVTADGTTVKEGDTVLTFARGSLETDLRDRETELAVAEANQKKVLAEYDDQRINRQLALKRSELALELAKMNVVEGVNLISKIELEKAKVELTRAQLQVDLDKGEVEVLEKKRTAALEAESIAVNAARQKVSDVRAQLAKMTVQAPASGILFAPYTRLNWVMSKVAPGKVVRPGDRLLEIPSLDAFRASIFVRQRDASNIKVGDVATVVPTMFPDLQLRGVVSTRDEFATTRNERSGSSAPGGTLKELRVVLDLEAKDDASRAQYAQLRPGGTVRADVTTTLKTGVVLLPLGALREQGAGSVVVDADGKERAVTVGQTSLTHAEITSGVNVGDVVRLLEGGKKAAPAEGNKGPRGEGRRRPPGAPAGAGPPAP